MFQRLLKKIAAGLSKLGLPYMVIGGQAVLVYGEPRLTKDIDITLGVGVDKLEKVTSLTARLRLRPLVERVQNFVNKTMVLPVIDEKSGIRVDFIFSFSAYEKQAIERAKGIKFGRAVVKFASLEDLVIHKIIAGRARDLEDVRSILLKNPSYDNRYIEQWLKEFSKSLPENFVEKFRSIVEETQG